MFSSDFQLGFWALVGWIFCIDLLSHIFVALLCNVVCVLVGSFGGYDRPWGRVHVPQRQEVAGSAGRRVAILPQDHSGHQSSVGRPKTRPHASHRVEVSHRRGGDSVGPRMLALGLSQVCLELPLFFLSLPAITIFIHFNQRTASNIKIVRENRKKIEENWLAELFNPKGVHDKKPKYIREISESSGICLKLFETLVYLI